MSASSLPPRPTDEQLDVFALERALSGSVQAASTADPDEEASGERFSSPTALPDAALDAIEKYAATNTDAAPVDYTARLVAEVRGLRERETALAERLQEFEGCETCGESLFLAADDPRQENGPIRTWWQCGECANRSIAVQVARETALTAALTEFVEACEHGATHSGWDCVVSTAVVERARGVLNDN